MTFEELYAIDRSNMYRLLRDFPDQLREAAEIGNSASVRKNMRGIRSVMLTGLGGSAIAGDLLAAYLGDTLRVPLLVNRHYQLPRFVGKETLLIVSSYSGNTEETISAYREGARRGAKILCISSGGSVSATAKRKRHPLIVIPGGLPPRTALGYSLVPILISLSKMGLIPSRARDIRETIELIDKKSREYGNPDPSLNKALQLAGVMRNRMTVLYAGADRLGAVGTRWRGQLAENAKSMAWTHQLPEMNHNEIVGWRIPGDILRETAVIMLRDKGDHKRVQRRLDLTKRILSEKTTQIIEVWSEGKSPLARLFSLVYLGDWVSYYLAILHGVDPTPVDAIDQLKRELENS